MSRSEDLIKMLRENGESAIDQLINDREAESLFLEFKRGATSSSSRGLESVDRDNLAKAISGFGNSSGGLLVWGVACDETAAEKLPIENAERFRSLIENAISGCTLPPHTEVENHVIPSSQTNLGFVVTHIPKSNSAPHQALGRRVYYIRAGSNFVPATHDTIAGLFGRRPQPSIAVNFFAESVNRSRDANVIRLVIAINLLNLGPAPVGDVFLNTELWSLKGGSRFVLHRLVADNNWTIEAPTNNGISLVSRDPYRLAPLVPVPLVSLELALREPFESEFTTKLAYGAAGAPITIRENTISAVDLKQQFDRYQAGEIAQREFCRFLIPETSS
jgi:hypothetical protein